MRKIFSVLATLVLTVTMLVSCSDSSSVNAAMKLKDAMESSDAALTKKYVDEIYANKNNACAEALAMELMGILAVATDFSKNDKKDEAKAYLTKFDEIYTNLQNKPDYKKQIAQDPEFKSNMEMISMMAKMYLMALDKEDAEESEESVESVEAEESVEAVQ